jgi:hypothetical protein
MVFPARLLLLGILLVGAGISVQSQDEIPQLGPQQPPKDVILPNGKSQANEILKADHRKNLEDAETLVKLSQELKTSLQKNGSYVFSIADLKKAEEIEKIAKRIHSRLKH